MKYKLGENVEIGQKILIRNRYYKIIGKNNFGVVVKNKQILMTINYGDEIDGWKLK